MEIKVNDCQLQRMLDLLDRPVCAKSRREKREMGWQYTRWLEQQEQKNRNSEVPVICRD